MITHIISFSHRHFSTEWLNLSPVALAQAVTLTNRMADNYETKFILEDKQGRPGLTLQFNLCDGSLTVWSARTNTGAGTIDNDHMEVDNRTSTAAMLEDWANKAAEGQIRCAECGEWVHAWKPFSIAGAVCMRCFNPQKHILPTGE